MASKKPRRRGYDQGGQVLDPGENTQQRINDAMRGGQTIAQMAKMFSGGSAAAGAMGGAAPLAKGGPIRRVAGKPIGKDDGLIPAQKGEYVVRKSAVNKLGTKALNQINRGKLPSARGR